MVTRFQVDTSTRLPALLHHRTASWNVAEASGIVQSRQNYCTATDFAIFISAPELESDATRVKRARVLVTFESSGEKFVSQFATSYTTSIFQFIVSKRKENML